MDPSVANGIGICERGEPDGHEYLQDRVVVMMMMMHVWLCQRQCRLIHLYPPSPVVFTLKLQDPSYAVD